MDDRKGKTANQRVELIVSQDSEISKAQGDTICPFVSGRLVIVGSDFKRAETESLGVTTRMGCPLNARIFIVQLPVSPSRLQNLKLSKPHPRLP